MLKRNKNKNVEVQNDGASDILTTDNETVFSKQPINSMFANIYCKYDYPYDDTYVKWLLFDAQTVVGPITEVSTGIPLPAIVVKDAKELTTGNSVPTDYIGDSMFVGDAEEEIEIL